VNLIVVSPFMRLQTETFTMGQTTLKFASNKLTKHEKVCYDIQHVFKYKFMFDVFDFLTPEIVDLLRKVQRVLHNNVLFSNSMNIVLIKNNFSSASCYMSAFHFHAL